jgi:hypothetical protein
MNGIVDSNPIDNTYWRERIEEYLKDETKRIYSCNSRIERISNFYNEERRYYLSGINPITFNLIGIIDETREELQGCYLKPDDSKNIPSGKAIFYIGVPIRAQQILDSKGYLSKFIKTKFGQKETKLFIVFICVFAISLFLIYNHTKGYKIIN